MNILIHNDNNYQPKMVMRKINSRKRIKGFIKIKLDIKEFPLKSYILIETKEVIPDFEKIFLLVEKNKNHSNNPNPIYDTHKTTLINNKSINNNLIQTIVCVNKNNNNNSTNQNNNNNIGDNAIIEVEECNYEPYSESCNCIYRMKKEKNELNKRLNDEINKNEILSIENEKLREKLENANNKIKQMEELRNNQIELNNTNIQSEYLITSLNAGDKILAVNFVSMGNHDIGHYNLICKNTDLFIKLEERLYKDFPKFKDYNTFFTVNGKSVKRFKSIGDNNIKNNDIISIFINED